MKNYVLYFPFHDFVSDITFWYKPFHTLHILVICLNISFYY